MARPATIDDAAEAIAIIRRSIRELCVADHQHDRATLDRWLANKTPGTFLTWIADTDNHCVVEEIDGQVRGVGLVRRRGEVVLFFVAPGWQRQGLGRRIHEALEAHAIGWGLPQLQLESTSEARRFYESLGYVAKGPERRLFGVLKVYPHVKQLAAGVAATEHGHEGTPSPSTPESAHHSMRMRTNESTKGGRSEAHVDPDHSVQRTPMTRGTAARVPSRATHISALKRRRSRLLKAYIVHIGSFASTCVFAGTGSVHGTIAGSLWMVLVTIPPVLIYTALVDRSCRRLDPAATTVGWLKIVLFTLLLTPLESSLVLPARNLWIARRILRSCESAPTSSSRAGHVDVSGHEHQRRTMDKTLQKQLIDLDEHDQWVRARLAADGSLFEGYHPQMEAVHRANAAQLRDITERHGWPGFSLVGEQGAHAAWRIAQHAIGEPDFMRRCRDLLYQAMAKGDAHAWQHAYMDDRIRVFEGRPQRYGTQLRNGEAGPEPHPVEDAEHLDARRQALGLPALADVIADARRHAPAAPHDTAREAEELAWRKRVGWL